MNIPRFSPTYLSGSSPSIGTPSLPPIKGLENASPTESSSNANFVTFQGDGTGLIMPKSETTDRMQAVLSRLDEESGRFLVSSDLLQDEAFLTFAEGLNGTDLDNFAHTIKGLRTPPDQKFSNAQLDGGMSAIKDLFENLQAMSGGTLSRVLEKAAELSAPIPSYDANLTYDVSGKFPPGSAAATPLHNFVQAIDTMDSLGIDEQASSLLEHLELYGKDIEDTLLQIARANSEVAVKIMAQMQDYSVNTQDDVFNYLAKLTDSTRPYRFYSSEGDDGVQGFYGVDVLANSQEVVVDMMSTFSSLMENYQLSDAQITDMTSDLSKLDNENQRSYLEITKAGLNTLLREDDSLEQLRVPLDALTVIEDLRSDSHVRMLVSESGFGTQHEAKDGQIIYEPKRMGASKQDKAQTVELVTANAWLNRGSDNNSNLIIGLGSLDAKERDRLIDDLSALNDRPLYHSSPEDYQGYKSLQERLGVINHTSDLQALLTAKEKLPNESTDNFWAAASFLGQESDQFVQMINRSNTEGAQVLVGLIVSLEKSVKHGDMIYEEALERIQDILSD